jgi:hypothetical protein
MSNVKVKYGDNAAGVASQLLAAARSLDLETSVVQTTSDGVFLVPEEVADEAGLSYEHEDTEPVEEKVGEDTPIDPDDNAPADLEVPAGTLEERVAWVAEGEDESERTKRANAVHLHEVETGGLTDDEVEELNANLTAAVHGSTPEDDGSDSDPEPLIGKALNEALEKAGLSKSGKVADKQARLAEHQNSKE